MCGCTGSGIISSYVPGLGQAAPTGYTPEDCDYTTEVIRNWYNMFDCVKKNSKQADIGLSVENVNSYLGYIQSALNYPDNLCYYKDKLDDILLNIVPRIIDKVPICINI